MSDCNQEKVTSTSKRSNDDGPSPSSIVVRPVRKRHFILLMFMLLTALKSFQWVCLASITNVAAEFYQVDNMTINATTILFMITFIVMALPANLVMGQIGLRNSILVGSIGSTVGALIKCFSCYPNGFAIYLAGHLIVGLSEPLFFSSYSQVASVWYPDSQVSLATSLSLLSQELGTALGFIVPSLVVNGIEGDSERVSHALLNLQMSQAFLLAANTALIICFFEERPQFAPGLARSRQIQLQLRLQQLAASPTSNTQLSQSTSQIELKSAHLEQSGVGEVTSGVNRKSRCLQSCGEAVHQVKRLCLLLCDKNFGLLFVGFGINVGVAYSLHTLLNQMIYANQRQPISNSEMTLSRPPRELLKELWPATPTSLLVGEAGSVLIIAGLMGSLAFGYLLDKFHQFKTTTVLAYLFCLISMVLVGYSLTSGFAASNPLLLHVSIAPLGFFLTGYACCGLEYAVELTYPRAEYDSSTLLNISAQLFGIPISLLGSWVLDSYGNLALGAFLSSLLSLGLMLSCLQKGSLKRQRAIEAAANDLASLKANSSPGASLAGYHGQLQDRLEATSGHAAAVAVKVAPEASDKITNLISSTH